MSEAKAADDSGIFFILAEGFEDWPYRVPVGCMKGSERTALRACTALKSALEQELPSLKVGSVRPNDNDQLVALTANWGAAQDGEFGVRVQSVCRAADRVTETLAMYMQGANDDGCDPTPPTKETHADPQKEREEPPENETPADEAKGAAPRDAWFFARYNDIDTDAFHKPAVIRKKWNAMKKEEREAICPDVPGLVSHAAVVKAIKRLKGKRNQRQPPSPSEKR